jgi:thioredoxin reductase
MGQCGEVEILRSSNITTVENDSGRPRPIFNKSGETNVAGLFLIGDLVLGKTGGSIITAFNSAVHAMRSICASYLSIL